MEQNTINQRLNVIVDQFENGKKASFARKAGISPQGAQELLAGRKGDPSFKVLLKILESYPQIQIEWLVRGRGGMLNSEVPITQSPMTAKEANHYVLPDAQYLKEHRNMIEQIKKNSEEVKQIRDAMSAFAKGIAHIPIQNFEKGSEVDKALKRLPEEILQIFKKRSINDDKGAITEQARSRKNEGENKK